MAEAAATRRHQHRLRPLRRHLTPPPTGTVAAQLSRAAVEAGAAAATGAAVVAGAGADVAPQPDARAPDAALDAFCRGVDLGAARESLAILRHFQGQLPDPAAGGDAAAAAAEGVADMMNDSLPKASRYVGCVVDASRGLDSFSADELVDMKRAVCGRGAVVLRGLRPEIDGNAANAQSVSAFLSHFGEPRAEYFGDRESELGATKWNADLPVGTLQKFSNDGDGVLLKSSSDELVGKYASKKAAV